MAHCIRMAVLALSAAAVALPGLAGCASDAPENAPAWYTESAQDIPRSYPSLKDVPTETTANVDPAYWAGVALDVQAGAQAMDASPRSEPAPPSDADAFDAEARQAIDATRDAH